MRFIDSKDTYWDKGMNLGIAMIVISLLASTKNPWVTFSFDWLLVFFGGISLFMFFMGMRLNTEINTKVDLNDLPDGKRNKNTFTSYVTYLDRFNNLSITAFVIAGIFFGLFLIRLLFMALPLD